MMGIRGNTNIFSVFLYCMSSALRRTKCVSDSRSPSFPPQMDVVRNSRAAAEYE